jgi:hypothetical protein
MEQTLPPGAFINQSDLEFKDISSESNRKYHFANGNTLYISQPLWLHVSASGGHRLFSADEICYYIQPKEGWYIEWTVKDGQPHFVK